MNHDQPTQRVDSSLRRVLVEIREFAGKAPAKAVAAAFGLGLLINLLPTRAVIGTVTVMGAVLMRPILLSLGVSKAMELCCQKSSNKPGL